MRCGQCSDGDQVVQRVAVRELPDRQRRPVDGTRREHRGHARAVLEARVEHRLTLGDLVAAGARDVLDRDRQIPDFRASGPARASMHPRRSTNTRRPPAFTITSVTAGSTQQILDRLQERQDAIQAAHSAPRSR